MTDLTGNWILDREKSEVGFTVRAAAIAKIQGRFTEVTATVAAKGKKAEVSATAQTDSFTAGSEEWDRVVKSADVLDVGAYPTIEFKGEYEGRELVGDLTIHGVTHPVCFTVESFHESTDDEGERILGAEAKTKIKRSDFNLTWDGVLKAGSALVGEQVSVTLDLHFVQD